MNHGLLTRLRVDGAHVFTRHLGASGPVNGDTHNLWVHTDGTIYTADSLCRDSGCFSAAGDAPGALSTLDPATTAASAQRDYAGGGYPSGNPILGNYPGDGYIVHLSQDGATVLGATLFGGPRGEGIEGVSVTGHGSVVVTGGTNSSSLPAVTTGAYSGGSTCSSRCSARTSRRCATSATSGATRISRSPAWSRRGTSSPPSA